MKYNLFFYLYPANNHNKKFQNIQFKKNVYIINNINKTKNYKIKNVNNQANQTVRQTKRHKLKMQN